MPALFRGLDRQALDLEYSPSAMTPYGLQPYLDQYAALSGEAIAGDGVLADLRFGPEPAEVLDLFVPAGAGPWPLHIFIHGGFWQALSQRDFAFIGPQFQNQGIAFASISYTIAPAATIGEMAEQCARAVGWLFVHARRWRLDPSSITVSGHSAGAHLCAMLLSRDCSAVGLPREAIKGAVLVSGVYDLEPIRLSYVNEPLHLSEAEVEAWSPIRLEPVTDHPIVLVWGENETQEFKRQSRDYGGWLERHGRRVSRQELGGRNHFDMLLAARENPSWLVASAKSLIDS